MATDELFVSIGLSNSEFIHHFLMMNGFLKRWFTHQKGLIIFLNGESFSLKYLKALCKWFISDRLALYLLSRLKLFTFTFVDSTNFSSPFPTNHLKYGDSPLEGFFLKDESSLSNKPSKRMNGRMKRNEIPHLDHQNEQ